MNISPKKLLTIVVLVSIASASAGFWISHYISKSERRIEKKITKPFAQKKEKGLKVIKISPEKWPDIRDFGDLTHLSKAVNASILYLSGLPDNKTLPIGAGQVNVSRLRSSIEAFSMLLDITEYDPEKLKEEVRRMFDLFQVVDTENKESTTAPFSTLVTGYFQPLIKASYSKSASFPYPVYSRPEDLVQVKLVQIDPELPDKTIWGRVKDGRMLPYYSRYEIDFQNVLQKSEPVAWLKSPVDGLMLQIQGSGILEFPDKGQRFIHYAGSNGRPYGSIGKWLIERGYIKPEDADWPSIRKWYETNPEKLMEASRVNPRYIFFRWEKEGPVGSMGAVLQPMRSVALDQTIFPAGALCFLNFDLPAKGNPPGHRFAGFVLNQDKGSAIKGAKRVDLYCGAGEKAGKLAGSLKNRGAIYILLLKEMGK